MISFREVSEAVVAVDRRLTPGPIQRVFQRHWDRVEGWASQAPTEDLSLAIRRRGVKNLVNTLVISGLALPALLGLEIVAVEESVLSPVGLAMLAGPTALVTCLMGPTRGIVRTSEREIFREELQRRGFTSSLKPLPVPE